MARGKSSFRSKVSANSAQQRTKAQGYGHLMIPRGMPIFKEEGDSRVSLDILPYVVTDKSHPDRDAEADIAVEGTEWYRRPYALHRNIGGGGGQSVVCPVSFGGKCPICEYRKKLLDDGANWQDEAVKALRASNRDLYYVRPKGDKKHDDATHLWDISQFAFQDKLNDELAENEDYTAFPDRDEGLTLRIRFSEQTIGKQKFAETSRIDFEDRKYKYTEAEIADLPSLDDVLIVKSYRELEHLFYEAGDAGDDDGAEETPQERERPAAASTREAPSNPEPEPKATQSSRFTRRTASAPSDGKTADAEPEKTAGKDSADADDRAARRAARTAREAPKPPPAGECPHGYAFGKDCDKHKECEDCKVWTKCCDELDRLNAEARAA